MRKILLLALAAGVLSAQTASYPSAIAGDTQMRTAANSCSTTLTFPTLTSDTTLNVANASCVPVNSVATIDNEKIAICNKVGNQLIVGYSSCPNADGRAFDNTAAATHANGAGVDLNIDAWHHNALKAEVAALEAFLGVNGVNILLQSALPLPVNKGGTGAATAAGARSALGAAGTADNNTYSGTTTFNGTVTTNSTGTHAGGETFTGPVDMGGASRSRPNRSGTGSPVARDACTAIGETYFQADGAAGANLWGCTASGTPGTWSLEGAQLPTATGQIQYLRTKPNAGNNSTYEFAGMADWTTADYSFAAQTPGGSLAIGNNTVTVAPVPLGVNGTDSNHRLWVSAGVGTAEACLISGGTAVAGGASGTLILNCANTHSGAWTVQSAAGGIQEALQAAAASKVPVFVPAGTITLHAAIQVPTGIMLRGAGVGATVLKAANGELGRTATWQNGGAPVGFYCAVCVVTGAANVTIRDLTVDENGANQSYSYISGDIQAYQVTGSTFDRVAVINRMQGGTGVGMAFYNGVGDPSLNMNNTISNASVTGIAGCAAPNGGGAYYIEGKNNRIINTYAHEICDAGWVIVGNDHTVLAGHGDTGSGTMSTPMFQVIGNYGRVEASSCTTTTGTVFSCFMVGAPGISSTGNVLTGNTATCRGGATSLAAFEIGDLTFGTDAPVVDTTFSNNVVSNCAVGFSLNYGVISKVTISENRVYNASDSAVRITSPAVGVGAPVTGVTISGNQFDHVGFGVLVQSGQTALVKDLIITDNLITDTSGSPILNRGIFLDTGSSDRVLIRDNIIRNASVVPWQIVGVTTNTIIGPNILPDVAASSLTSISTGAAVASGSTIAPTGELFHVTGTAAIGNISPPVVTGTLATCITMIPDGAFTWTAAGNVATAGTAVVGKQVRMCYEVGAAKWYPSY